jgi:hypothetical protein
MEKNAPSAICGDCRNRWANMDPDEREYEEMLRERREMEEGYW